MARPDDAGDNVECRARGRGGEGAQRAAAGQGADARLALISKIRFRGRIACHYHLQLKH